MNTKLFAVTGNPVLHSKSPLIFNTLFKRLEMEAVYFRLAASEAAEALSLFRELKLTGMNVTAPFKTGIMTLLDEVDEAAAAIGGVNTVVREGKRIKGYNTDYWGVTLSLKAHGLDAAGKNCLVLGAGGAARAAAYALKQAGGRVRLANRTWEKACETARALEVEGIRYEAVNDMLETTDILISTLPPLPEIVAPLRLRRGMAVFDANYKVSPLSYRARREGCETIMGEEWLLNQAMPAFKLFLGVDVGEEVLRETGLREKLLAPALSAPRKIVLTGFMGAGKTAVGKELAKALDFPFIDLDSEIEIKEGRGIPDIFKFSGEARFRALEKSLLNERLNAPRNVVIALGGGVVADKENCENLEKQALAIWLHSSVPVALKRIPAGSRPLLETENPEKRARELFLQRAPLYARVAHLLVSSEKSIAEIVEKICHEILKTYSF